MKSTTQYNELNQTKERLQSLAKVINELDQKFHYYGMMYGQTRDNEWYTKRKYAREGWKMAKAEFAKLERKYRKMKGIQL